MTEIPAKTLEFLASLEEDDIKKIKSALKTYDTVEALRGMLKFIAYGLLAIAVAITQFGESISKIKTWFH